MLRSILWPTQHINEDLALNIRTGFDKALVDAAGGESFAKPVIFLFALRHLHFSVYHVTPPFGTIPSLGMITYPLKSELRR